MNNFWKKLLITCALVTAFTFPVNATETVDIATTDIVAETTEETVNEEKPLIALGADLTSEQRAQVLAAMGVSEADLANYNVIYEFLSF